MTESETIRFAGGDGLSRIFGFEWPTVTLIVLSYALWAALAVWHDVLHPAAWIAISAINVTLFMSITHEVVHGHPTTNRFLNKWLIAVPIGWTVPYERFRDTHMQHHKTPSLTDPFEDPESWYVFPARWQSLGWINHKILEFNNTLFGRMLVGPVIGLGRFFMSEAMLLIRTDRTGTIMRAVWFRHVLLCLVMVAIFAACAVPLWKILASIYLGHSLLYVRTFLEHQASDRAEERTVIIEKACPIAFLFLFNNYHFVHHARPSMPWYRLPGHFRDNREFYLTQNNAYAYTSYVEVFRRYFFRMKEPVIWPNGDNGIR